MRIGGLASGFDTEQIVRQLMEVERLPLDRMYQQKCGPNGSGINIEPL